MPKMLEFVEEPFDAITKFVGQGVMRDGDIAAPLPCVEQQGKREPGAGADRVRGLKLRDLGIGPRNGSRQI
jgi:hypothetical protein